MKNPTITHDMHVVHLPHEGSCFAYFFAIDVENGMIVGVAKATPWRESVETIHPFVSSVHVHKDFRRQGIARGLMQYIERTCFLSNVSTIAMYVHRENVEAQALYASLGYFPMLDDGDDVMLVKQVETTVRQIGAI